MWGVRAIVVMLLALVVNAAQEPLLGAGRNLAANLGSDRILRVPRPKSESGRKTLGSLLDKLEDFVDVFGETSDGVDVRVPTPWLGLFREAALEHKDTTDEWMEHFRANFANKSFVCQESAEVCANADDFYSKYQKLDAINGRIQSIQSRHPSASAIQSLGTSYEGRDQQAIRIGNPELPIVFYFCGEHAREWIPPMFCVYLAEKLLEAEGRDGPHTLLNDVNFVILPVMNPDGYEYSHTNNNMWRKSRQPNAGSDCIGTDLNRNYAFKFAGEGSSNNPCSDTYHGVEAFDNKETQSIKKFADANADNMLVFTDVHAYGYMWMNPWGWTYDYPANYTVMKACGDAAAEAIKGVHGSVFETGTAAQVIYVCSGASDDWMYGSKGVVFSFNPEVRGRSFQPDASNIMPSNEELFAGMEAQVKCALANTPGKSSSSTDVVV